MNDTQTLSRKTILCVDDDADTCDLLQFVLDEYEFVAAHSVERAFHLLDCRRFDLHIFDNWLPDGTGIELCRRVRALPHDAPIIFVSGVAQTQEIEHALENGADKYLVKPCEPETLKKIVKELIG